MLNSTATTPYFHVAPESESCMLTRKRFVSFENWTHAPMNTRISVVVRALFIAVCLLLILQGKPPVLAQRNEVISVKDETQDIELGKLSEFKTNQENWNSQNGQQIQALTARVDSLESNISSIEGWEKGGFGVLTALSILAMFFQLKRKGDKPQ